MDNLLKEAIADAKAVRETALANAKIALEEAFTPHLKSMLSKKLQAEMDHEDEDKKDEAIEEGDDEDDMKQAEDKEDMEEELKPSGIGASDNKEPDAAAMDTSKIGQGPESEGSDSEMGAELDAYEKAPDQAMGENTDLNEEEDEEKDEGMHDDEDKKDESIDEDLEEALRQLEAEMAEGGHEEDEKEEGYGKMNAEEDPEKDEMYGKMNAEEDPEKDEELDLEAIIKALTNEEEDDEMEEGAHDDEEKDEAMVPAAELEEYKQTVEYLREKLQEVNLLNAKLLYTNKLFRSRNVSEAQKMKVIEQFDRAANVREVKLVYTTFAESMERVAVNESARKVSQASKPVASTKPSKPIINEETDFRTRMKKLANIL